MQIVLLLWLPPCLHQRTRRCHTRGRAQHLQQRANRQTGGRPVVVLNGSGQCVQRQVEIRRTRDDGDDAGGGDLGHGGLECRDGIADDSANRLQTARVRVNSVGEGIESARQCAQRVRILLAAELLGGSGELRRGPRWGVAVSRREENYGGVKKSGWLRTRVLNVCLEQNPAPNQLILADPCLCFRI